MNKRTKTDRELLLDASLEFIMNSPEEVFDQYLKEAGEDGSELERRATDAIGAALARHESASADELIAALRAETAADEAMKLDAQRFGGCVLSRTTPARRESTLCIGRPLTNRAT